MKSAGSYQVTIRDHLNATSAAEWNGLRPTLFARFDFLDSLQQTGCVGDNTGWLPQYLMLHRDGELKAACPLYLKFHSYGEYVFDWAWADAYERANLRYYPKLLCAIPFTPITTPKLLAVDAAARVALVDALLTHAQNAAVSSLHCLFLPDSEVQLLSGSRRLQRSGVQYHWRNRDYDSFEHFLGEFNKDRRKKIKQERKKVEQAGVSFRWLVSGDIRESDWQFFHQCYRQTYREHRSSPYLNQRFFVDIGARLHEHTLLIVAEHEGAPVASALFFFDDERLYGRYWGSTVELANLHFEVCYYQAIEFCIAKKLRIFEGGAQGEHKIARGLMPVETKSVHWLADARFSTAIETYLQRESKQIEAYLESWQQNMPLKSARESGLSET